MNMKDLIEKIELFEKQLAEKEHELHLLKEDLEAMRATIEAAIEGNPVIKDESPLLIQEEPEEAEELIVSEEKSQEMMKEEKSFSLEVNEEHQHEAIMRTIEEFSQEQGSSIVKQIPESESVSLADKVSIQPLNDIKKAIGINEQFLFANVLFNGDMNAFSKAVEELNHLESISDATRLMDEELSPKYHWSEEDETVIAFKTLVSRRFS
tara:strand:+ start:469 stop:1095 length:627 start_codon:yes stop_codon:yes gene_type:complete